MSFNAKVQSISGERITLVFEDGQQLTVAPSVVEGNVKEGMDVSLLVTSLGAEDAGRTLLAREILNSLL